MRRYNILLSCMVFVLLSNIVVATPWVESCSVTLHPNQNTTCGLHNISNIQFSSPVKAHLFNGTLILDSNVYPSVMFSLDNSTIMLSIEQSEYISPDEFIRITSNDITPGNSMLWEYSQYNPSVTIHVYHRKSPQVTLSVSPEHPSYKLRKNVNIIWNVTVSNPGDVPINHVIVNTPQGSNQINAFPTTFTISTELPYPTELTSYSVNLSAYYDVIIGTNTERKYLYSNASVILETPQNTPINNSVFLYKTIKSRIYTENNTVTLSLANPSTYYLTDVTIIDKFKSTGINHTWHFDSINSSESKTVSYIVLPSQVGSFTSPRGYASFYINGAQYNVTSASVPVTVVSMNNKVNVSSDEVYVSPTPIPISVPISDIPAQPTIPGTAQPKDTQQPQVIVTPTFRIPGFEIINGIFGLVILSRYKGNYRSYIKNWGYINV